ncbi:hypothetical protein PCASD_09125 [Puccinia coronata f. sp. avenae]|uniref:Uncharacterized protein n=1 Tax=Puccinia coronata f. sp. avenae TaxID=200324 RepID=A0A2N5V4U4_9BASI|nr:hypothetical protein PCASD_09125 [Puccinia coronata f. sp. avenae]
MHPLHTPSHTNALEILQQVRGTAYVQSHPKEAFGGSYTAAGHYGRLADALGPLGATKRPM